MNRRDLMDMCGRLILLRYCSLMPIPKEPAVYYPPYDQDNLGYNRETDTEVTACCHADNDFIVYNEATDTWFEPHCKKCCRSFNAYACINRNTGTIKYIRYF
jgi:hypothetical protein